MSSLKRVLDHRRCRRLRRRHPAGRDGSAGDGRGAIRPVAALCRGGRAGVFRSRKKPRAPADLFSHDCLRMRLPSGKLYHWEFEKRGEEIALDVTGALTLGSAELRVEAALAGLGLASALGSIVADHLATGRRN
ncbi:MAG: LysR substrate-binding domain-containing protein [Rhodanobacter sp.]